MKIIYSQDNQHILRIERGEEVVEKVLEFCEEHHIDAAWVQGLGAVDQAVISYYDLTTRQYIDTTIAEECELLSLQGNIAFADGKRMLHAHINLSRKDYSVIGGHLKSMTVSGTGEIYITKLATHFSREYDEDTGLKLLKE